MDKFEKARLRAREAIAEIARREGIPEEAAREEIRRALEACRGRGGELGQALRASLGAEPWEAAPEDLIAFIAVNFF